MKVLVDTNILLRLAQKTHQHSAIALQAIQSLLSDKQDLVLLSQLAVEFWAVATRPAKANGLNLTVEQTLVELADIELSIDLLPELPVHAEWQRLVTSYRVSGKNVHDARLVAAMVVHGVTKILTFNDADFTRYAEISVLDPFLIA